MGDGPNPREDGPVRAGLPEMPMAIGLQAIQVMLAASPLFGRNRARSNSGANPPNRLTDPTQRSDQCNDVKY